jgi:hypothetical protein
MAEKRGGKKKRNCCICYGLSVVGTRGREEKEISSLVK